MLPGLLNVLRVFLTGCASFEWALFSEVPAPVSGISWCMKPQCPRAASCRSAWPGLRLLDYQTMDDVYLLGDSGPKRNFWKPSKPVRNALYEYQIGWEWTGVSGAYSAWDVAVGDYEQRRGVAGYF